MFMLSRTILFITMKETHPVLIIYFLSDCCDGSDEYDGGATCANICEYVCFLYFKIIFLNPLYIT